MKIGEIIKDDLIFDECQQHSAEDLLGKPIELLAVAARTCNDGDFLVIKCRYNGRLISFTNGGKAVISKLAKVCKHFGMDARGKHKVVKFPEPITCKLVQTKSKEGRLYYDLVDIE